jgi:Mu transposase, C-terminal domain
MLAEEQARLHPIPASAHTVAFGVTRTVPATTPMVAFEGGQYSVPARLLGQTVWVRVHGRGAGEQVIIVHVSPDGPTEVARHPRATAGSPKIDDDHFPAAPAGAVARKPLARNSAEVEFLTIGDGARLWLTEAAAAGTTKIRVKMAQAVTLAKLFETTDVDWALGHAAVHARFAEADLASILDHHHTATSAAGPVSRASEHGSLTQGTRAWAALGTTAAKSAVAASAGVDDGEQEMTR